MTAGGETSTLGGARKVGLLSLLYFCQGLPFGFQATALPIYLRASGVSLTAIGFLGALSLPWITKALWAPLVDRWGSASFGRRRSWILPTQLGLALTCGAAALVPPQEGLGALLALVFLMNLLAATQDIAVDGLAVDLLGEKELGPGNTAQVVGYKLGMLTSGGLLVGASAVIGWRGLLAVMGVLVLAVAVAVLAFEEPPAGMPPERRSIREILRTAVGAVTVPGGGWLLAFVATYKVGESMIDAMWKLFLVDGHFPLTDIGMWLGTWGMLASLAGSAAAGLLASRVPLMRALAITAILRVLPLAGEWALAAAAPPSAGAVVAITIAEHFFGGALTVAMFAYMMSRVDRRIGATHYTLLASVEVLGKSPGAWASGPIAAHFGYAPLFGLGVALSALFLLLLIPMRRSETERTGAPGSGRSAA